MKSFQESGKKHLLITGSKKSGKTMILNEILKEQRGLGGIITDVIRDDKIPPKYVTLRDRNDPNSGGIIARRNDSNTSLIPITETFEVLGRNILKRYIESPIEVIVIDEIGFLENNAKDYQNAILNCLEKKKAIFIIKKQKTPLIEQLVNRQDVYLVDMDELNR